MGYCALQDNKLVLLLVCIAIVPWVVQSANPQDDLNYLKFVYEATEFSPNEEYDYIVVGGGTAGCPLAATLSENHSVLLLERGGTAHTNPNVMNEARLTNNVLETDDKDSPAQAFTPEDGMPNVRGRALGGTSLINFGIYSRADDYFYNISGINWDIEVVKSAYEWVEETVVFRVDRLNSLQSSAKEALLQSGIGPDNGFSLDHNVGAKVTGSTFDETGRRHGSVNLLNKANPSNLKVVVHATVERVIFSTSTTSSDISAVGVIYHDTTGKTYQVGVGNKGEVILSAGALGSTQLMLLSGVGPRSYLSSLSIPVVYDQPFVGQFVVDNPRISASYVTPFPLPNAGVRVAGITNNSYMFPISGLVPFFSPVSNLLFPYPPYPTLNISVGSIIAKLARPLSTGTIRLASATDVTITPIVRFNYFANPIDLSLCIDAARHIGKYLNTPIMEKYKFQDQDGRKYFQFVGKALPDNVSDNEAMQDFCRTSLGTIYHYHGGCSMTRVVDNDLRVVGIGALRIVDGSTFVVSPGTNPQATLMMLGRHIGLKMQEERAAQGA